MLENKKPICFSLETSERSGKPTEVSRRLFAYFLVGEKVGPRRNLYIIDNAKYDFSA